MWLMPTNLCKVRCTVIILEWWLPDFSIKYMYSVPLPNPCSDLTLWNVLIICKYDQQCWQLKGTKLTVLSQCHDMLVISPHHQANSLITAFTAVHNRVTISRAEDYMRIEIVQGIPRKALPQIWISCQPSSSQSLQATALGMQHSFDLSSSNINSFGRCQR